LIFSAQVLEIDHDGVAVQLEPPGNIEIVDATPEQRATLKDAGYELHGSPSAAELALADADYDRGCALMAEGKCDEAILAFNQAFAQNPADVQAIFNRGYARAIKLRSMASMTIVSEGVRTVSLGAGAERLVDLAIEDFTLAISYNQSMSKAYGMRAEMYWMRGQVDLARADWMYASRLGDETAVRLLRERFGETN
jgi:tetratricopeptide (TPR) repeat protein